VTPLFESGLIWLPDRSPWVGDFIAELIGFPLVTHDDQVDSTSQYLSWTRKNNVSLNYARPNNERISNIQQQAQPARHNRRKYNGF
jgi:hypothetical protein